MVHKFHKKSTEDKIAWGFDLTQVKSDEDFLKLLKKYGFKKVSSKKPSDIYYVSHYDKKKYTYEHYYKKRFKEFRPTFVNKDGIRITVEHLGGKGEDKGHLGYIGINAPSRALPILRKFLKDFRGREVIKDFDVENAGGITTYVKEESPFESEFIGVE